VRRAGLILSKDLRVLRRSPLLLGILVAYPILIAVLVGLVAGFASAKPRVALVDEDGLPPTVTIAGHTFDVARTIDKVGSNVKLVRLSPDDAKHQLDTGKVVAVVTVPPGFVARLRTLTQSPTLELETTRGGLAPASSSRCRRSSTRSTGSSRAPTSTRTSAT
jgi:ABC-2 type transport system permease protein